MRLSRMLALGASMLVLFGACSTGGGSKPAIKIGSVGFDEARVVAEIYAQALEANGYTVDRAGIGLGHAQGHGRRPSRAARSTSSPSTSAAASASATAGHARPTNSATEPAAAPGRSLDGKGGGSRSSTSRRRQDTNAFVVRKETADQFSLTKMSDLDRGPGRAQVGARDGLPDEPGLRRRAQERLRHRPDERRRCLGRLQHADGRRAHGQKTIDVAELCSTGPEIIVNGWVRLEDDKGTQPADNIAPLVRNDFLAKIDKAAFSKILNDVSAKIDTATLADLYKQVAVDKKDLAAVAKTWLQGAGPRQVAAARSGRPVRPTRHDPNPRLRPGVSSIPGASGTSPLGRPPAAAPIAAARRRSRRRSRRRRRPRSTTRIVGVDEQRRSANAVVAVDARTPSAIVTAVSSNVPT